MSRLTPLRSPHLPHTPAYLTALSHVSHTWPVQEPLRPRPLITDGIIFHPDPSITFIMDAISLPFSSPYQQLPNISPHPRWHPADHHKSPLTHSSVLQTLGCIVHPVTPILIQPRVLMLFPLLLCSYPYTTHQFTEFHLYHMDGDPTILKPVARLHVTHIHTLKHLAFYREHGVCPTHYPYGR